MRIGTGLSAGDTGSRNIESEPFKIQQIHGIRGGCQCSHSTRIQLVERIAPLPDRKIKQLFVSVEPFHRAAR